MAQQQQIGRFEIRRLLGRGAQSAVYLAYDPHLEREVAIKTLHFGAADAGRNAALLREARTVSQLRHPNVVPIFEAGEQDGDPYLVFEFVDGGTLSAVLRERAPLPAARAVEIAEQVLDALAAAHGAGIIHRDLKPANILLSAAGVPRVMDFGIAARAAEGAPGNQLSGTPAYMAPEYIAQRRASAQSDVFAVGLILYEMLYGRRAVPDNDALAAMKRLQSGPIEAPADSAVRLDERLAGIVFKAAAFDAQLRYESAQQMREALAEWARPPEPAPGAGEAGGHGTLEFLLRRMRHRGDFPALSEAIRAINRMASSDSENVATLSNTILKDFALTNKILRLVNSAFYRQSGAGKISTVSRAIVVLGFDAVRSIAISLILFEHLQDKGNAAQLKEEFLRANVSAMLARELARHVLPRAGEEAFICAMFHRLGRLLTQYYFRDEADEIRRLQAQPMSEDAAAARVLGLTYEALGIGVAKSWGFPEDIVHSMRQLPAGAVRAGQAREERLRVLAGFANEVCAAVEHDDDRAGALARLKERFGASVPVDATRIAECVDAAAREAGDFCAVIGLSLKHSPLGRQVAQIARGGAAPDENTSLATQTWEGTILGEGQDSLAAVDAPPPAASGAGEAAAGAAADDAHAVLAAGIQDISNCLVEEFSLNDVLRIVLETMYRALGFRRVLLAIRDPRAGVLAGRFGFGPDAEAVARRLRVPLRAGSDVFSLVLARGVDLLISDAAEDKIAARIPEWFRRDIGAPTFLLLPLVLKGAPVALIYADRERAGDIVVSDKELSLLRTLRNQALLAIKQKS